MNSALEDRKFSPLRNITNNVKQKSSYTEDSARWEKFDESHWFPMQPTVNMSPVPSCQINSKHRMFIHTLLFMNTTCRPNIFLIKISLRY